MTSRKYRAPLTPFGYLVIFGYILFMLAIALFLGWLLMRLLLFVGID